MSAYEHLEMNEEHSRLLHQLTGLPEDKILPAGISERYWRYKRCCDKASVRVTEQDLVWMCVDSGLYEPVSDQPKDIVAQWRSGEIKAEARIKAQWGKGERSGVIKNVTAAGDIVLVLDGEGEERKMKSSKITLAEV